MRKESIEATIATLSKSTDFVVEDAHSDHSISYYYLDSVMGDKQSFHRVIAYIKTNPHLSIEELHDSLPIERIETARSADEFSTHIMRGSLLIGTSKVSSPFLVLPFRKIESREITVSENEYSVSGPKEGFIEDLDVNINLIRKRIAVPELVVDEMTLGSVSKSRLAILYLDGVVNDQLLQTVRQRLKYLDFDEFTDIAQVSQLITDSPNSPFAQLLETERPDRVATSVTEGKVTLLLDGSPLALIGPTTLIEFFASPDDYYDQWPVGMFIRMMRICAVVFSVVATSFYIAITTFHHELIPDDLLITMVSSRMEVPYPPIIEVLILELTIELLREAGARLPERIGQTIGIVGGIVIGTAVVEASLASSVLLIIVALTALASFTTPIYQMGNAVRMLRFPFIFFAQLYGFIGISICLLLCLRHLLTLKSYGYPYLAPIYPLRVGDFKDSFFHMPMNFQEKRPSILRPKKQERFKSKPKKRASYDIEE
ncbi:spore germination protein [Alkalihalobacillus sp. LMS6]|uniref:spore germination protein n=1 Tax=Alkalihalobacillus sp. LMS6 TaxID=2924034 RepID=UPI0020D1C010|nr:spore germination protein [Alkalihalobacillus sp. LMS6]UTR07487.1 spore germination protein [Alkalihalobacillus sp. LMS6]